MQDFLEYHDFAVFTASDGLEADQTVNSKSFDLILLDLMLPEISGEELCNRWREKGLQTPIIMLTAKGQENDKINGLNSGADDYITKPFSLEELLARINAVLRRTDPAKTVGHNFKFANWNVDVQNLTISSENENIELSAREAAIIQYFAANPNRIISRKELYGKVWKEEMSQFGTRTVDMHIAKLRGKIEQNASGPDIITTIRGAGYKYSQ
ncbi:MAG: response regulator transcription factor [Phycisphaerae bacterium]|nr:response regulator transcription factor [Phycisphaerae bacterium]